MGLLHSVGDRGWAAEMRSGRPCSRRCGYDLGFVVDSDFVFYFILRFFYYPFQSLLFSSGVRQAQICFYHFFLLISLHICFNNPMVLTIHKK